MLNQQKKALPVPAVIQLIREATEHRSAAVTLTF